MMQLTINGEAAELPTEMTVRDMLSHLQIDDEQVAVEQNTRVVPKSLYGDTLICAEDIIEIVEFIGGG